MAALHLPLQDGRLVLIHERGTFQAIGPNVHRFEPENDLEFDELLREDESILVIVNGDIVIERGDEPSRYVMWDSPEWLQRLSDYFGSPFVDPVPA